VLWLGAGWLVVCMVDQGAGGKAGNRGTGVAPADNCEAWLGGAEPWCGARNVNGVEWGGGHRGGTAFRNAGCEEVAVANANGAAGSEDSSGAWEREPSQPCSATMPIMWI
jgi:hypothetical protein